MPVLVSGTSVLLAARVEVRASTDTASTVVPKLMDVEAMLAGLKPCDLPCYTSGFAISLKKSHNIL